MIKLSKKQLKKQAEDLEAYYFTGNVYNYENCIEYLKNLAYFKNIKDTDEIEQDFLKNVNKNYLLSAQDIIESIKRIDSDTYTCNQLAYSAGVYGNSGQLHEIKLYKNNNLVARYYFYY